MPIAHIVRTVPVKRSPRVLQLEGLFDIPPTKRSEVTWDVSLPLDDKPWNVGLIVGPSGCGKTTIARELFGNDLVAGYEWPSDQSLLDGFPAGMGIKDITSLLSSVGFSSPPSWLRPFGVLSNGEQFRTTIARALAEDRPLTVIDEFTSVIDRTVAQIGSAAIAKTVRRLQRKLIAVSCHYDIVDWLCPEWIYEPATATFAWRLLQPRPAIALEIARVDKSAWNLFKQHHYMSATLHPAARCFVAFIAGVPVAFASSIHMVSSRGQGYREHRTVCLPDYQGVGIGNALSEFVGGVMLATGKKYFSVTSNPAMIRHRAKSPLWDMHRPPQRTHRQAGNIIKGGNLNKTSALGRLVAGFTYVGPARPEDMQRFGIRPPVKTPAGKTRRRKPGRAGVAQGK